MSNDQINDIPPQGADGDHSQDFSTPPPQETSHETKVDSAQGSKQAPEHSNSGRVTKARPLKAKDLRKVSRQLALLAERLQVLEDVIREKDQMIAERDELIADLTRDSDGTLTRPGRRVRWASPLYQEEEEGDSEAYDDETQESSSSEEL